MLILPVSADTLREEKYAEWLYAGGEKHHSFDEGSGIFSEIHSSYFNAKSNDTSQSKCNSIQGDVLLFRNYLVNELNGNYFNWYVETYIPSLPYVYKLISGERTAIRIVEG